MLLRVTGVTLPTLLFIAGQYNSPFSRTIASLVQGLCWALNRHSEGKQVPWLNETERRISVFTMPLLYIYTHTHTHVYSLTQVHTVVILFLRQRTVLQSVSLRYSKSHTC